LHFLSAPRSFGNPFRALIINTTKVLLMHISTSVLVTTSTP